MTTTSKLSENAVNGGDMVNEDFEPSSEEEAVLSVLEEEYRANPYLIREETGLDKGTTNTALTRLTSAGWVRKVTRGLYEFVEDPREPEGEGGETLEDDDAGDARPPADVDEPASSPDSPRQPAPDEPEAADIDALVDEVAEDVLPGSGEKLEARREALRAVVYYLREQGSAKPKDFREDVYPDHQAYYTEGSDPPYSWWTNAMYDGMSALAERTDTIEAADSTGVWRWRGGDQ